MLFIYTDFVNVDTLRQECEIDLSTISSEYLADECDKLYDHKKDCTIFFGFLEPGFMLDLKHEARIRKCIRKFNCHLIVFHLESLPWSWKNEIHSHSSSSLTKKENE